LPTFTEEQREELIGSLDFMGLNHYSTLYASVKDKKPQFGEFSTDPSWRKNYMVSFGQFDLL
jgi:hypothetical protein